MKSIKSYYCNTLIYNSKQKSSFVLFSKSLAKRLLRGLLKKIGKVKGGLMINSYVCSYCLGEWNRAAVYYGEQNEKTDIDDTGCRCDGYDDIFLQ